jgi:hypothetical protein
MSGSATSRARTPEVLGDRADDGGWSRLHHGTVDKAVPLLDGYDTRVAE